MRPGREADLLAFVHQEHGKPFAWGERDCNTLVLQCLDILTGCRPHFALIAFKRYATEAGAYAFQVDYPQTIDDVLRQAGAVDVEGDLQAGDFLLVQRDGEPWLRSHVCLGEKFVTVSQDLGVVILPIQMLDPSYFALRIK